MNTYHIHIIGIVQGVGFRPFVYKIANGFNLNGFIQNGLDGVHFEFNADESLAIQVYKTIVGQAPSNARIYSHNLIKKKPANFNKLEIITSEELGEPNIPLTPDFALCQTCRNELAINRNRRFQYPFITCTFCGPRYSITKKLPYDRHTTTMDTFNMCSRCKKEYDNPLDRRYYSQTNSCKACGISLMLEVFDKEENNANKFTQKEIINSIVEQLNQGRIIAVKGIGGYLLICNANHKRAIQLLRIRKHRPTKPFAVMYPSFDQLNSEFEISAEEKEALTNEVGSIVLLRKIQSKKIPIQVGCIAPKLNRVGCMIPYAPLYQLILNKFRKPIIATSANISGSPIIYTDTSATVELRHIADSLVRHNRPILMPQDDSVILFSSKQNQKIIYRRSRGLAPTYENSPFKATNKTILACGGQMKSSFALLTKNRVYVSQYLGDMDNYLTQKEYCHTINHLQSILACKSQIIICDKHPNYFTTEWAKNRAKELTVPIYQVQHHKAHFAAVLAENNLLKSTVPILGVIWDGTGLGNDQQIWGGEFFLFQNQEINRATHIGYFPFILGNKMPKEPRLSALCVCNSIKDSEELLKPKFTNQEWLLYQKIVINKPNLSTSSMGRLFDAVASLLLNINKTSYEGEAAIRLENLAKSFSKKTVFNISDSCFFNEKHLPDNCVQYLIKFILSDIKKGIRPDKIAYYFHISLVDLIRRVAIKSNIKNIAFSGGVFQNELLTDMIITCLQNEFSLFFHKQLPPNDENISFGQLACYMLSKKLVNP